MNKIAYIVDYYSHDSFHEVINLGYLMMISSLYKKVFYIASISSIENQKKILKLCNVELDNVEYYPQNVGTYRFKPYTLDCFIKAIKVGVKGNKTYRDTPKDVDIFYNNNLHFTMFFNHFFGGNENNVFYLCHAEMELIKTSRDRGYFACFFKYYLWFIFRKLSLRQNCKIILLSQGMADYFKCFISKKNRSRVFGMDHCYIRPVLKGKYDKIDFNGIKIGIPGSVNKERGIQTLKEIISLLNNPLVKVFAISSVSEKIYSPHYEELNKTGGHLPFDLYSNYIKQMDAYLLLYDLGSYQLSASGALLEAVWNERPIFALKNAYFSYMFEKFGELGYLADSVEELAKVLDSMNIDSLQKYNDNIRGAKEMLLPKNVSKQLKKIINA